MLDSPDATLTVDGAINLQSERYDLTIHPQSKGLRVLSLRSPLFVRGSSLIRRLRLTDVVSR